MEVNAGRDFIKEAERACEVTKVVGLASKNPEAEVVQVIARNMALEASEKHM